MTDAHTRVKRKQSLTCGRRSCCLPTVGRASQVAPPRVRSGGPSAVGQGRRGDIHVARIADAYTRVKRGQSLTCGRIHAAGGHVASLRSAGRHKWRPHGVAARFVGGMTRGHVVPDGHRASQVAPPRSAARCGQTQRAAPVRERPAGWVAGRDLPARSGLAVGVGGDEFVALAVDVDDFDAFVLFEVFAQLGDVNVH